MSREENEKKKQDKNKRVKKPKKRADEQYREYRFSQTFEEKSEETGATREVISSKAKTAVVIMLICLISVVIATGWNYLAPDKLLSSIQMGLSGDRGDSFPTFISGTKVSSANFQFKNNRLTYISDTSLIALNNTAAKVIDRPISFSQPAMKICGDNILTYGIDGTDYQIDGLKETRIKNQLDNKIIQGDIAANGSYAFLTGADGYLSKLTAFNSSDKQIFSYSFSDYYATAFDMNNSGTMAAVTTVTSNNGSFKTKIYILDLSKEEPASIIEEDGTLAYACEFMDNGSVAAVCDDRALMIKSNYTDIDRFSYDGLSLTAFAFDEAYGGALSLSPSGDGGNCHIVYLNKNGSLDKIADTEYRISDIDIYGGKIAALCGAQTVFYKLNGEEAGTADSGLDAQAITMKSENSVYVLGMTEIRDASAG